jgi:hypothetical protein
MQQDIYLNTLKPNGSNISPSIIDFSLFDGKNSQTLLYDLSDLVKRNDSGTRNMIIYLSNTIRDINENSDNLLVEKINSNKQKEFVPRDKFENQLLK